MLDDWCDSVYYYYYEYLGLYFVCCYFGVWMECYKLIYFYWIDEWEMYDFEFDFYELNSVYVDLEYVLIVDELKKEFEWF